MLDQTKGALRLFPLLAAVCGAAVALWMMGSMALATAAASAAGGPVLSGHPVATSLPGRLTAGSYTNGAGRLDYELYVPSTLRRGARAPLVVGLHGCTQSADAFRRLSRFDALGQSEHFIVLFPQQLSSRNSLTCWNWFVQADMRRGSGEPAIIAGMVHAVEKSYSVNTRRVYVAGFSAGGAMANVMGATYPDVFAAVGSGSGCEYNGLPCVGQQGPPPSQTGLEAYRAMGRHARVVPAIVFQGDADNIVAPANGSDIAQEWQVTDNYVLSGSPNGPIQATQPFGSVPQPFGSVPQPFGWVPQPFGLVPSGQSSTVDYSANGRGGNLIEYRSIHGMGHAWSGGNSSQQYADPSGPSETNAMYAFFAAHPLR
jgi:poly(hydroxyalkanoate) depolymerase family esterase